VTLNPRSVLRQYLLVEFDRRVSCVSQWRSSVRPQRSAKKENGVRVYLSLLRFRPLPVVGVHDLGGDVNAD
jgi:hypothetical protein